MSKPRNFDKKIVKQRYGINAGRTMAQVNEKNNVLKCDEDTIIRTEIHAIIVSSLEQRKDKKDIIKQLSENKRYKKYAMYFENWITDKMKKVATREVKQK